MKCAICGTWTQKASLTNGCCYTCIGECRREYAAVCHSAAAVAAGQGHYFLELLDDHNKPIGHFLNDGKFLEY
jgi:hypothetical protein